MDHLTPSERSIVDAARRHLAAGTLPTEELVELLAGDGAADALEVSADELYDAVVGLLLETDGLWITTDAAMVVDVELRLDRAVFTHRLTEEERTSGRVRLEPDLVHLQRGVDDEAVHLPDGSLVRLVPDDLQVPGEDHTHLAGPDGWLAGFAAGEAVAFARRGTVLTVTAAAARPGSGGREAQLLRDAHTAMGEGHGGPVWLFPLLLEVLATNDHAFRAPVRPVLELLADSGFAFDHGQVGVAGADFVEEARRENIAELICDFFHLQDCCLDAFELARTAFDAHAAGAPAEATRELAAALGHGDAAPALLAYANAWSDDEGPVVLANFAEPFAKLNGRARAGGALLMSLVVEHVGEIDTAVALAEEAVLADASFDVAIEHLARLVAVTGDLEVAIRLRQQLDYEDDPDLGFLLSLRPPRGPAVGRNEPCPCGSGRKYKVCCMNTPPELSVAQHAAWLDHKLARYVQHPPNNGRLVALALQVFAREPGMERRAALVEQFIDSGIPIDWTLYDDGLATEFAARYAEVLPAVELAILEDRIARPLALFEVEQVTRPSALVLRDLRSGERVDVIDPPVAADCRPGDLLLARLGLVGGVLTTVGQPLHVDEPDRERTLELVIEPPTAFEMAGWYAELATLA